MTTRIDECRNALPTQPQEGRFINSSPMQEPFLASKRKFNQMVFSRLRAKVEGRATCCIFVMLPYPYTEVFYNRGNLHCLGKIFVWPHITCLVVCTWLHVHVMEHECTKYNDFISIPAFYDERIMAIHTALACQHAQVFSNSMTCS